MSAPRAAAAAAASASAARLDTFGIPPSASTRSSRPGARVEQQPHRLVRGRAQRGELVLVADDVRFDHRVELAREQPRAPAVAVVLHDGGDGRAERGERGGVGAQRGAVERRVGTHYRSVVAAIGSPDGDTTSTRAPAR